MAAINQQTEPAGGWSGAVLKRIGYLLLTAGVLGRAVFENGLLDIRQYDNAALLAAMQGSGQVMQLATLAIVLQGIGLCAVPLFTFALVEGMRHTANVRRYGLRVALLALASEIPYNLAFEGRWWAPDTRSPAAGLLLALLMLWLMDHYGKGENRWKSGLLQAVILAAAVLWALLLRVDHGVVIVALAAVLWLLRRSGNCWLAAAFRRFWSRRRWACCWCIFTTGRAAGPAAWPATLFIPRCCWRGGLHRCICSEAKTSYRNRKTRTENSGGLQG